MNLISKTAYEPDLSPNDFRGQFYLSFEEEVDAMNMVFQFKWKIG